jgi:hypothetical protein
MKSYREPDPHHGSRYHGQADHLSWPLTLDFFRKHLTDAVGEGAIAS